MAEWLRRGLQILARRFDSGSGLHFSRRRGARGGSAALAQLVEHIIRNDGVTGSSPVSGTRAFSQIVPKPLIFSGFWGICNFLMFPLCPASCPHVYHHLGA